MVPPLWNRSPDPNRVNQRASLLYTRSEFLAWMTLERVRLIGGSGPGRVSAACSVYSHALGMQACKGQEGAELQTAELQTAEPFFVLRCLIV